MRFPGAALPAFALALGVACSAPGPVSGPAAGLEPVPDRLAVLTFDDSVKSHFTA